MDMIDAVVDHCIRRGLGFAGLAIGTVMLSLSFDFPLALRTGANMLALTAGVLIFAAWRAPRRDQRRSEAWSEFSAFRPELASRLPRSEAQRLLSESLRRRLIWHAERVSLAAIGFWAGSALASLMRF